MFLHLGGWCHGNSSSLCHLEERTRHDAISAFCCSGRPKRRLGMCDGGSEEEAGGDKRGKENHAKRDFQCQPNYWLEGFVWEMNMKASCEICVCCGIAIAVCACGHYIVFHYWIFLVFPIIVIIVSCSSVVAMLVGCIHGRWHIVIEFEGRLRC